MGLDLNSDLVTGFAKAKNSKWRALEGLDINELLGIECQGTVDILQKDDRKAIVVFNKETSCVYSPT